MEQVYLDDLSLRRVDVDGIIHDQHIVTHDLLPLISYGHIRWVLLTDDHRIYSVHYLQFSDRNNDVLFGIEIEPKQVESFPAINFRVLIPIAYKYNQN